MTAELKIGAPEILVIDDDEDAREMLATLFELDGFHVATAANDAEAAEHVAGAQRPRVVVAEVALGGARDWVVCERLAGASPTEVPVIVYSALAGAIGPGPRPRNVRHVLAKPAGFDALRDLVARYARSAP